MDSKKRGEEGEILDRLEVFNSVEVLAPEIDDLRKSERLRVGGKLTEELSVNILLLYEIVHKIYDFFARILFLLHTSKSSSSSTFV